MKIGESSKLTQTPEPMRGTQLQLNPRFLFLETEAAVGGEAINLTQKRRRNAALPNIPQPHNSRSRTILSFGK